MERKIDEEIKREGEKGREKVKEYWRGATDRPETSFHAFTRISGDWMGVRESQPISVSILRRERLSTMTTSCPCAGFFSKAWDRWERGCARGSSHGPGSGVCDLMGACKHTGA